MIRRAGAREEGNEGDDRENGGGVRLGGLPRTKSGVLHTGDELAEQVLSVSGRMDVLALQIW